MQQGNEDCNELPSSERLVSEHGKGKGKEKVILIPFLFLCMFDWSTHSPYEINADLT